MEFVLQNGSEGRFQGLIASIHGCVKDAPRHCSLPRPILLPARVSIQKLAPAFVREPCSAEGAGARPTRRAYVILATTATLRASQPLHNWRGLGAAPECRGSAELVLVWDSVPEPGSPELRRSPTEYRARRNRIRSWPRPSVVPASFPGG